MKCPHCLVEFHDSVRLYPLEKDTESEWGVLVRLCPHCNRNIIELAQGDILTTSVGPRFRNPYNHRMIRPRSVNRMPVPPQVHPDFVNDYKEACLVLSDSPKASAALSRRCLQHLLREKGSIKKSDLANEIQQILDAKTLPSYIAESLDAVRNTGNFASHPIKSTSTGEIVPVEPGEAEWNLDVLEMLFDFYFVQPDLVKKRRDALNKKLADVGKPPMK
ncbi:MAG: DUF4145 domain-containing protein [Syntrophaceae bacterium]|nr:DUF4145 domain-containing protein [Syntrophaceae bacterium]